MRPVPEREAAKVAGERYYTTGKPCRNGHMARRYTATGACSVCAIAHSTASAAKRPEHPARIAARVAGEIHYSTGTPCRNGHDMRFVSNGVCVECGVDRQKRYHAKNPGLGAKWAKAQRAKDPRPHRESALRWAKMNPENVRQNQQRTYQRNPEKWRRKKVIYTQRYLAQKKGNGGTFTEADIEDLHHKQGGKCAGCGKPKKLEIDHILAVAKGGTSDPSNLQLLCRRCNASKGDKDVVQWRHEQGFAV